MDEINKSVLNNLRSGQYYIDARDWYSKKYIYPIFERSLIFVIAVIFLIALAWGWYMK
jgi:type IV secretion system protein VirB8